MDHIRDDLRRVHCQRKLLLERVLLFWRWQFAPDKQVRDIFKLFCSYKLGDVILSVMNAALSAIPKVPQSQYQLKGVPYTMYIVWWTHTKVISEDATAVF